MFADAGIQAEASGTALKNIILGLANPSSDAAKGAIAQLGIQARNANGELRNIYDLIPELQVAFESFNAQQQGQFAQDIFGREAIGPFLKLLGTTKQRLGEVDAAYAQLGGTAQANKEKLQQGLAGATEALGGSIGVLKLDLASAFAPGVETATRFFQSIIDNITANKTLFDGLKNSTKEFTDLLKENAGLSEAIADSFENLISAGLETSTELALDLFTYLSENPKALSEMVEVMDTFVRLLADATRLAVELGQILGPLLKGAGVAIDKVAEGYEKITNQLGPGGQPGAAGRQVAGELGLDQAEFDKRLEEKAKATKGFNSPVAYTRTNAREQAVDEVLGELIQERAKKQRADTLNEGADQGLKAAAQRAKTKTPEQATQAVQKATDTAEKAVDDMEAKVSTSLSAIALAETERAIDIQKMVMAGVLSHEEAEIKKLESTKQRINEEIKIERERLNFADNEQDRFKAKEAIASKTLDLLKIEQEIEQKVRDMALNKLREQTQLQQQQLGLQQQAIALQKQELSNYDVLLNRLSLVEASLDRQQRLQNAQNDLEATIINAQIERSNLRLQQLEKAKSLYQQLQGELSENQRRVLTEELGRLGLAGRVTERDILRAIHQEERRQFELKRDALEQQQRIQRESLQFEKQKTQLQIQQNNLAAERAVKEAQFNLESSKLQNQQQQLEAQTKLKEAQIQATGAKTEAEKQQAQALVNLYSQQLGLIQKQGQLLISQGQSAIQIARENQASVAQEGAISLQELDLRGQALAVTQQLERDKLNNEYQNALSGQRIAESQLEDNSKQKTRLRGNKIEVKKIPVTRIGGDREPLNTNKNKPVFVTPQPTDNLVFNNSTPQFDISQIEEQLGLSAGLGLNEKIDTKILGEGLQLRKILNTPIENRPLNAPIKNDSIAGKSFQDQVLLNMKEIVSLMRDNQPITQNNEYSLYANDDTELLQQAKNQSLDDLVKIFQGVTGKFYG